MKREFREELDIEISIDDHFYTVDFFQPSAFDNEQQVISIYYLVSSTETKNIKSPTENEEIKNGFQSFRWIKLKELTEDEFTFPIDKKVTGLIISSVRDKTVRHS